METKNQNVVFIGAGNLATNFALAFFDAGLSIQQVFSRNMVNAETLAKAVNAEPVINLDDISTGADFYVIAVPDGVIPYITSKLKPLRGIVTHTSGSTSLSELKSIKANGYGVIYPFQTFTRNVRVTLDHVPIFIESDDDVTLSKIREIAEKITSTVININSDQRAWLHLTGVFASNFTNHMLTLAYKLSERNGIDFSILQPLVEETTRKAFAVNNPAKAQTGPAVRNDTLIINKHLEMLKSIDIQLYSLYKELSLSIQKMDSNNQFSDEEKF